MDPRDIEIEKLQHALQMERWRLKLAEEAIRFERRHSAFLMRTFVLGQQPKVRPKRSLRERCALVLEVVLAGVGRG